MGQIFVIHPGNRGVNWCDMESSRFFVRDDKIRGESFQDYTKKFIDFPLSAIVDKKLQLIEPFKILKRNEAELAIFPNRPGWVALSGDLNAVLNRLLIGTTFSELDSKFDFGDKQLHYLLAVLYTKGVIAVDDTVLCYGHNLPELNCSDEMALIELTRACNLRCKHCFNLSDVALPEELSFDEICELVNKIIASQDKRTKDKTIVISGGEPFLHHDIFKIIDYINEQGYCVEILTNGTLMTSQIIQFLSKKNVKVRISLDGCTPETHEWMRGKGTFSKAIRAIESARDANINIGITTSISDHNFHEIEEILKLVDDLKVDFFQFIIVNQLGRAIKSIATYLSDATIYEKFYVVAKDRPDFRESMRDSTLGNMIACNITGLFFHHCGLGLQKNYYVQANGDMFPCRATILPELKLGNVRELELTSFIDFKNEKLEELQQLKVDSLNPTCSSCSFRYWCSGDCRGETYQSTRNFFLPSPHCNELIEGFETVLWLTVEYPDLYFEKSNAFYRRTDRTDFITQALQDFL